MKLAEFFVSSKEYEISDSDGNQILSTLSTAKKIKQLNSRQWLAVDQNKFIFVLDDKPIGFISIAPAVTIENKLYSPIRMIFVRSDHRGPKIGLFLIGLRSVINNPLIVGTLADESGSISAHTAKMLKDTLGFQRPFAKVLNLKTGALRDLTKDDLTTGQHSQEETLVFEDIPQLELQSWHAEGLDAGLIDLHAWLYNEI